MILVTGGAGFIGRNLLSALLETGTTPVWVVDDARAQPQLGPLAGRIAGFTDKREFVHRLRGGDPAWRHLTAAVHLGARTDTAERDWRGVLDDNYHFSVVLLESCQRHGIPLIYASTAAVYGRAEPPFLEQQRTFKPASPYACSKWLLDRKIGRLLASGGSRAQLVGLRPFNVYGPGEEFKGRMASVIRHFHHQLLENGTVRLFKGSNGYADGEQRRDFVHVDDLCAVIRWFLHHPAISGIFNVGTGISASFNDVARAVIGAHGHGRIEYVPMPDDLRGHYQAHTEANIGRLRNAGYTTEFRPIDLGIADYIARLLDDASHRPASTAA